MVCIVSGTLVQKKEYTVHHKLLNARFYIKLYVNYFFTIMFTKTALNFNTT